MRINETLIKTAYWVLGLSILVLTGLGFFQHMQIKKLSQGVNRETPVDNQTTEIVISQSKQTPQKNTMQTTGVSNEEKDSDTDENDDLEYQLDAAEEELDMAHEQLSDELSRKAEYSKTRREMIKKMYEDPSFRTNIRKSLEGSFDSMYGPLCEDLNLGPEDLSKLKGLSLDHYVDIIIINQETLTISSEEEKSELQKRFEKSEKEYEAKYKELLLVVNYEKYKAYEDRLNERYLVTSFMESLGPEEKLTKDQQQDIIDLIYEERQDAYAEINYDPKKLEFPLDLNEEKIAKKMRLTEEIHTMALEKAGTTLSPSQAEKLKDYLKNQRDIEETSLKLILQEYGY